MNCNEKFSPISCVVANFPNSKAPAPVPKYCKKNSTVIHVRLISEGRNGSSQNIANTYL